MGVFEAIVVFVMIWWVVFLPSLSAGTQSQHEAGEVIPGTDRAAPTVTRLVPKLLLATGVAFAGTVLVWVVLHFGWLNFLIPKD